MAIGKTNICSVGGGKLALTVLPSDVRLGKTFTRDGKNIENGMLNLVNLKPDNIKKGINIGGVTGNYTEPEKPFKKYFSENNVNTYLPYTFNAGKVDFYPRDVVIHFKGQLYVFSTVIEGRSFIFSSLGEQNNNVASATTKIAVSVSLENGNAMVTIRDYKINNSHIQGTLTGYIYK